MPIAIVSGERGLTQRVVMETEDRSLVCVVLKCQGKAEMQGHSPHSERLFVPSKCPITILGDPAGCGTAPQDRVRRY